MREELAALVNQKRPGLVTAMDSKRQLAALDQRIFQLKQSLQSVEIVPPPAEPTDTIRFGATVTVRDPAGEESTWRIVGVDETDFDRGWVSWLSPIARALINARRGERVRFKFPSGEEELEIVAVDYN